MAPVLSVTGPGDESYTNQAVVSVTGTAADGLSGLKSLTVNGTPVVVQSGSFSYALTLSDGANVIRTVATDNAGNAITDTRTVTLDTVAPVLVVATPADNAIVNGVISLSGSLVSEPATVTASVNGGLPEAVLVMNNTFSHVIVTVYGLNHLEIKAVDRAGNTSTVTRSFTYDNQGPALSVTDPGQDMSVNQGSYTLKGRVADLTALSVTVTVDGIAYTPPVNSGYFEQTVTFTIEKTYEFVVTALDQAGNTSTVKRKITYDKTAPTLKLTAVTSPTNQSSQTLAGTRDADGTITVSCSTGTAGAVSYPTGTTWRVALSNLSEGENHVAVEARNPAGNVLSLEVVVVLDTVAPETLANPLGGTYGTVRSVTLTANEAGTIYYTLDGTEPTTSSLVYGTPIPVTSSLTLKYFAKDLAGNAETVKSQVYTLTFPLTVTRSGMGSGTGGSGHGCFVVDGSNGVQRRMTG